MACLQSTFLAITVPAKGKEVCAFSCKLDGVYSCLAPLRLTPAQGTEHLNWSLQIHVGYLNGKQSDAGGDSLKEKNLQLKYLSEAKQISIKHIKTISDQ